MSAPASISNRTTSALFSAAAHISAVWPRQLSIALTAAPRASSALTTLVLPVRAAVIRMVSPAGMSALASAPASRSASTTSGLPLAQANDSGVIP